jgi:hypothetical protein
MKKIIALLLALACVFALASCAAEAPAEGEGISDGTATIEDYTAAIAATSPTKMTIETKLEKNSPKATLEGAYTVEYQVDGTAVITGSYEKLNDPTADEFKSKVPVNAEVSASGKVSGDTVDATVSAAAVNKIDLNGKKFNYEISMGTLNVTISAANTESVLGFKIDSEVKLILRMTNDGKIGSYSINYTTAEGSASIVCMYE